jgi:DNA-binding transcriptional MocR family regulator
VRLPTFFSRRLRQPSAPHPARLCGEHRPDDADTRVLFGEALRRGICFAPGDVFSASGRYQHCLRLSCGHGSDRRIEAGVETIGALAVAQAGQGAIHGQGS